MMNDSIPNTIWTPAAPIPLGAGGTGQYIALFLPRNVPLEGLTGVDLVFDDGCHKGVSVDIATPTLTPTPDCNLYTLSEFDFHNSHQQEIMVTNGDPWNDTKVTRIRFDWTYFQQKVVGTAWENIYVDWFTWNGASAWGWGDRVHPNGQDMLSWTDTQSDSPSSWKGPLQFNHGNAYALRIDFDGAPGGGSVVGVTVGRLWFDHRFRERLPAQPGIDSQRHCDLDTHGNPAAFQYTHTNRLPAQQPTTALPPTATAMPTNTSTPTITPTPSNTPKKSPTPTAI